MLRCRPTSTSLGEITHIAQSFVGKVLSSCDITPPIGGGFFDQVNIKSGVGQVESRLHAGNPAANYHNGTNRPISFGIHNHLHL